MTYRLPSEAYQFAETYCLGKPTAMYDTDFKSQLNTLLAAISGLLVFFIPFVICRNSFRFDYLSLLLYGITIGCILFAGLCVFAATIVSRIPSRDFRIYIYSGGLVYKRPQSVEVIHWDEVERVDYGTIHLKNGTETRINRYVDLKALEKNIKRKIKRYHQSQYQQVSNVDT